MILHINKSWVLISNQNLQISFKSIWKISNVYGHSRGLFTSCRTCPSWHNGPSLGRHVLNGYEPVLMDIWVTSYQNMEYQSSLRRRVIIFGSERAAWVSRRMDCRIGVIEFYVSANNNQVTQITCHVCGFICYLCVELKLMIKTRSLSNQALKSAHPSLLSSRCWPWGVFIRAGQPLQHGQVRDSNLAWGRHVVYSTIYSVAHLRKHQSSASLAFVREIHRWPMNSPHKWTVTRKMVPFDDVIMILLDDAAWHAAWPTGRVNRSLVLVFCDILFDQGDPFY